jgi:Fe2+ or Zn2+ uptake regulation protein
LGNTQQRQIVLDVIRESKGHLTAEEIFIRANKKRPNISLSTIYRNLGLLVEQGKILSISAPDQPTYFDHNVTPHHHLVCKSCGKLEDICDPKINVNDLVPKDYKVISTSLIITCICKHCQS